MKKLFCLLFLLLFLPLSSSADPGVVLCYRMNHYAAAYNENHPGYFPYDTMIVDVYLMDDFKTAYYTKTEWIDGKIETTGFVKCIVSKGENNNYVLTFPNNEKMYFDYDENGDFWLTMEYGTYRLYECERFEIKTDLIL